MGFLEDLTVYWWNTMIWQTAMGGFVKCWLFGGWGLVFDDDDGAFMSMCFDGYDGLNAVFPVMIQSSFATEPPSPPETIGGGGATTEEAAV